MRRFARPTGAGPARQGAVQIVGAGAGQRRDDARRGAGAGPGLDQVAQGIDREADVLGVLVVEGGRRSRARSRPSPRRESGAPARPASRARPPREASTARGRPPPAGPARSPPAPTATRRSGAATRRRPRSRPSAAPAPSPPPASAGSPRSASGRSAARRRRGRPAPPRGPGSTSTSRSRSRQVRISLIAGIGDRRHPGVADQRDLRPAGDPPRQLGRPRRLVSLVVGDQRRRRRDPEAVEQGAGAAGVLAGDVVGVDERLADPRRDVVEVADRRRADDELAGHQRPRTPARAEPSRRRRPCPPPARARRA